MPIYKIVKLNRLTTKTGKLMIKADLSDVEGNVNTGLTIWSDYPNFATLEEGHTTEGDIVVKGDFKTLYPARTSSPFVRKSGPQAITKAMETKKENIKEAQTFKNESIKLAAIQRDAVLLVTTFYPEYNTAFQDDMPGKEQAIKDRIMYWKKYLEQVYGDGQPF